MQSVCSEGTLLCGHPLHHCLRWRPNPHLAGCRTTFSAAHPHRNRSKAPCRFSNRTFELRAALSTISSPAEAGRVARAGTSLYIWPAAGEARRGWHSRHSTHVGYQAEGKGQAVTEEERSQPAACPVHTDTQCTASPSAQPFATHHACSMHSTQAQERHNAHHHHQHYAGRPTHHRSSP